MAMYLIDMKKLAMMSMKVRLLRSSDKENDTIPTTSREGEDTTSCLHTAK